MEYNHLMKGLKLIRISIIFSMIVILLDGIQTYIFHRLLASSIFWDHYWTIFMVYDIVVYIGLIGSTTALIISGVGLYNIKKDSHKIGDAHVKDMKWAMIFFWITLSISIASWLRIFIYRFFTIDNLFMNVVVVPTFFEFLFWISLISMILFQLLPLRKIAGNDQRRLGSIYAIGRIIIPGFLGLFFFVLLITRSYTLARILFNEFFILFISFLTAFIFFLIFRTYHETILDLSGKDFRSFGKILKIKFPFSRKFDKGLARPNTLLVAFVIVGIAFSISYGIYDLYLYGDYIRDLGGGGNEILFEPEIQMMEQTFSASDYLAEGESLDHEFNMGNGNIERIDIDLTWTDEQVRIGLHNEPDTFSITLLISDTEIHQESGSNGGLGFGAGEGLDDRFATGSFIVRVEMINAGDITGVTGIVTRAADNGNEYDLQVTVEYITMQ